MSRWLHHFLLLLLLLAAVLVWVSGRHLSQHEELRRMPEGRAQLQPVIRVLRNRLDDLEERYTGHLQKLARRIDPEKDIDNRHLSQNVVGVARCSNLYASPSTLDIHADIDVPRAAAFARPVLTVGRGFIADLVLLPLDEIAARRSGWLTLRDQPPFYYQSGNQGQFVVLTIDPEAVANAMAKDLAKDTGLAGKNQQVVIAAPDGRVIARSEAPAAQDQPPDVVLPLPTRFGVWQVHAWDKRESVTVINQRLRAGSSAAAVLLAGVGIATWWHQRRALRTAQQRVSFVNSVSHELRTPLTNILLNLDLAAEDVPANARLDNVRQEAGRLGRLIENVLTFSRTEQGKLRLQARPCEVAATVQRLTETFQPLFARRGIAFTTEVQVPSALLLDEDALTQILSNLLSNVEKYAPQAAASLKAFMHEGDLQIIVADLGPGIPGSEAQHVFEPFARLGGGLTEGVTGTGLGLTIARELARRMGGDLVLVPAERGACFQLHLPCEPPAATTV